MVAEPSQTDVDPQETEEWVESLHSLLERDGVERAHFILEKSCGTRPGAPGSTCPTRRTPPMSTPSPYVARGTRAREARGRAAHPRARSLERARHGGEGEPALFGARRAHRELRLFRHPLRRGIQPLLARAERFARRRPGVLPGTQRTRNLRARLPRKAHFERPAPSLPPGSRWQGPFLLPPSVADAALLAVPDRLDGARSDHGHLPGSLHEVPAQPRAARHRGIARSGPSWEMARWTSRSRWAPSPSPRGSASTTSSSSSTATCSAWTDRCAATARSSRSSKARFTVRAGRSSR